MVARLQLFFLFIVIYSSLVISRLGSLGLYQKAVYFYCCLSMFYLLSSLILILWYMNLINNGQMDRDNENPTQHLPWWLRKTTKKPQSGWSAPGFEPGTSRMRVSCVTTEPSRSVFIDLFVCCWLLFNDGHVLQLRSETVAVRRPQLWSFTNLVA